MIKYDDGLVPGPTKVNVTAEKTYWEESKTGAEDP